MKKNNPSEKFDLGVLLSFQISQLNSKLSAQARGIISQQSSLTLPQWRIIRLLGMRETSVSTVIRKTIGADKSQFSKSLSLLIKKGFIASVPNPNDKRQGLLSLTPSGKQVYAKIRPFLIRRNEYLLEQLTPEQLDVLLDAISILGKSSDKIDFNTEE